MKIFKQLGRLDVSAPNHYFASHLARYAYIRDRIRQSSRVLDLGCGIAYGARFICASTVQLVALDISAEAIQTAKSNYSHRKMQFVISQGQTLLFCNASFDAKEFSWEKCARDTLAVFE